MQSTLNKSPDFLMDTAELATYLGKAPAWIRENVSRLNIPSYKLGKQWRYRKAEIDEWLSRQCR